MSKADISLGEQPNAPMPAESGLSEPQESILFAIWKLRGIGSSTVTEDQLMSEVASQPAEAVLSALTQLQSLGFVGIASNGERRNVSITPLGVAILRKLEEDRLQEIK